MKKGLDQPGKWGPLRFKATWKQYRYGSAKKVSLAPIFKGERRESAVQGVLTSLRDWRFSQFEHEGSTRAGVRQALCLDGHGWDRSDAEAISLVKEGLHRLGAKRPDWEEGQWHYSVPRENCARCGGDIDIEDQARGFRYCSAMCAKAYRQHLSDQVPWDHELRRQGYWQIVVSNAPVKTCPTCARKFKSANPNAVYCSPECLGILQRRLEDRPCKWCKTPFRPKGNSKIYCSMACRDASRVSMWKQKAPTICCPSCNSIFRPASPRTIFCSPACFMIGKNARRRMPQRVREASCETCCRPFMRERSDKRYCSTACNWLASRLRRGDVPKHMSPLVFDFTWTRHMRSVPRRPLSPAVFDRLFRHAA